MGLPMAPTSATALRTDRPDSSGQARLLPRCEMAMDDSALSGSIEQRLRLGPARARALKVARFDRLVEQAKRGAQA